MGCRYLLFSSDKYPEVELLGHMSIISYVTNAMNTFSLTLLYAFTGFDTFSHSLIFATFLFLRLPQIHIFLDYLVHLISPILLFLAGSSSSPCFLVFLGMLYVTLCVLFYIFSLGNSDQSWGNYYRTWQMLMGNRTIMWNITKRPRESAWCRPGMENGSACWKAGCWGLLVRMQLEKQAEAAHRGCTWQTKESGLSFSVYPVIFLGSKDILSTIISSFVV